MDNNKLDILKELFVDESQTLNNLKRLKDKSLKFFRIEKKTGEILIENQIDFSVREKILLFLIGKYFCKEVGFEEEEITSRIISDKIRVQRSSLTSPLSELESSNILNKDGHVYSINYYRIEEQLDDLNNKYGNVTNKHLKPKNKTVARQNKIRKRKPILKPTKITLVNRDKKDLENYLIVRNINKDELDSICNIYKSQLVIIHGYKGINNAEEMLKCTLLIFIAYDIYYDTNTINSSELRSILNNSSLTDIVQLSTILGRAKKWFIHNKGMKGSTKTTYRIKPEGYKQALILFRDIIDNTTNFTSNIIAVTTKRREIASELHINQTELDKNITDFSKLEKVDEEKLRLAFEFGESQIRIIESIQNKIRKIEQIKNLLLIGYIIKKIYKQDKFNCSIILKFSNVNSDRLDLLDSSKAFKSFFSINKPKTAMSLIYRGEVKASESLSNYLNYSDFEL